MLIIHIPITVLETELRAADTLDAHSVIELHRYSAYIHVISIPYHQVSYKTLSLGTREMAG